MDTILRPGKQTFSVGIIKIYREMFHVLVTRQLVKTGKKLTGGVRALPVEPLTAIFRRFLRLAVSRLSGTSCCADGGHISDETKT